MPEAEDAQDAESEPERQEQDAPQPQDTHPIVPEREPSLTLGMFRVYGDPGQVFKAIGAAQDAFDTLIKDKDGFHAGHKYVPLPDILDEIVPKLRGLGFTLVQPLAEVDGHPHVVTLIGHEDGSMLVSSVSVPRPPDMQDFGSNVTYLKRYSIEAFLALAAQEDDDARHSATKNTSQAKSKESGGSNGKPPTPKQVSYGKDLIKELQGVKPDGMPDPDDWASFDEASTHLTKLEEATGRT